MSCYPPTTHRWEREGATDWLRCKRCRDRKYDGIGPSIAPVERADIPLETYWTDRTAALAEALHGLLSTQLAALMHQRDGHKRVIGYRGGGETLRGDDLCDFYADRIVTEWLGTAAKDALLYLREHGWTLEREETA